MSKYFIRTDTPNNPTIREVDGTPVSFPGFEEFGFFVHPACGHTGYNVTEASTGHYIGDGYSSTKEQAIQEAADRLKEVGLQKVRDMRASTIAKYGALQQPEPPPEHDCPDCGDHHTIKTQAEVTA